VATRHHKKLKGHSRDSGRSSRSGVSRREYAELVLRLGSLELQVQRNRAELELHAHRIADLQETVEALKLAAPSAALSSEIPSLPAPPKPVVES
jgi:hypothetical protein